MILTLASIPFQKFHIYESLHANLVGNSIVGIILEQQRRWLVILITHHHLRCRHRSSLPLVLLVVLLLLLLSPNPPNRFLPHLGLPNNQGRLARRGLAQAQE